ncbi:acetyl-CoA C-acetyltransferase [Pseudomonas sp. NFACC13-1]|uniref:acetyl-CoA C-acetyltransferase n=1 Tax=Pseudomonas sp. NFACC13-1 TaxID=1566245 RepID=UPI0008874B3D|nr:acetyl-CoA C-acetyltransferase [Pseudomonas sp. NFACC13-1]SDB35168.1 acetyl-CoA C-acetyltransferase [Pseudomonas sp. NFACC13-1]
MTDAYIYDHIRTPRGRGRLDGALAQITPVQLAAQTLIALRERNRLDTTEVGDVILGCVAPIGEQGANLGRLAAIVADYDQAVPGQQINRFCASALESVNLAAAVVAMGQADAIVAGGVESMSRTPMGGDGGPWYADPQTNWKSYYTPQGIGADLIATLDGYSRQDVDSFAVESQRRAAHAWEQGYFARSVVPVRDVIGEVLLRQDEHMRPGTRLEDLAKLKAAFTAMGESGYDALALQRYPEVERIAHVHTGGNSSGIVDGASAVLIGSRGFGQRSGLVPRGRILGFQSIGSEPTIMLTGPAPCSAKLLQRLGLGFDDIDLFEVNEAFASVVMRFMQDTGVEHGRINVNGGSIAMGHPLGATGAMLVGTALDELERRGGKRALITLCAAAGMATATVIERI